MSCQVFDYNGIAGIGASDDVGGAGGVVMLMEMRHPFSCYVSWKSTPFKGRAVVPSGPSHHPADFPSLYRTFPLPFETYPEDGPITEEKMDLPDHGLTNEKTDLLGGLTQSLPFLLDLALLYHCSSYLYPCSLLFGLVCLCLR